LRIAAQLVRAPAPGNRDRRMLRALVHVQAPVAHRGAVHVEHVRRQVAEHHHPRAGGLAKSVQRFL